MHHPTDRIAHTIFVKPVMKHWLEREIAQWVHHEDQFNNPCTMSKCSYHGATSRSHTQNKSNVFVEVLLKPFSQSVCNFVCVLCFSAEIGFFYLVYYTFLAGFFAGLMAVFYQTLDSHYPKLMGQDSLLRGNPGT